MTLAITTENLEFSYGDAPVLRGVDLSVETGEAVCLLDPNGVGRMTLVENLLGSSSSAAGRVCVFDTDPCRVGAGFRVRVGLVQQSWIDHTRWRVRDQLGWVHSVQLTAARWVNSADEVLDAANLSEKTDPWLSKLLGGQRHAISFAAVLMTMPKLLVLNEPTIELNLVFKARLHDLILARVDDDTTIVMTIHDLVEARYFASRVLIMNEERILVGGTATMLCEHLDYDVEIAWVQDGTHHVHSTNYLERFVEELDLGAISAFTIARPILEGAYLSLVDKGAHSWTLVFFRQSYAWSVAGPPQTCEQALSGRASHC